MSAPSRRTIVGGLAATLVALDHARAQMGGMNPGMNAGMNTGMNAGMGADVAGPRVLEARAGALRLEGLAGDTPIWGYDGATPGPVLRVRQGADVWVRLANALAQPTTLHWHGLRNDNAVDGVAGLTQPATPPGGAFDSRFRAADAGLFLYRPAGVPAEQAARGLGGLLIVDEPQPPPVDRDIAFVLQDWALRPDGAFQPFAPAPADGRIGDVITANGARAPIGAVFPPGARVRLRLANACAARICVLTFAGARPFVLAIDGQPCEPFEPVRNILPIAPGARFDLVVDLPGQEGAEAKILLKDGEALRDLAAFKTAGAALPARGAPPTLPPNPDLPPEIRLGAAKKIQCVIEPPSAPGGRWTLNGEQRGYGGRPFVSVKRGAPVSIAFINKAPVALAMHVHGQAMRLLHDLDDGWEPYWRNAVIVPRLARKIVALLPLVPGRWAIRSDIADQEAAGLATWMEVT